MRETRKRTAMTEVPVKKEEGEKEMLGSEPCELESRPFKRMKREEGVVTPDSAVRTNDPDRLNTIPSGPRMKTEDSARPENTVKTDGTDSIQPGELESRPSKRMKREEGVVTPENIVKTDDPGRLNSIPSDPRMKTEDPAKPENTVKTEGINRLNDIPSDSKVDSKVEEVFNIIVEQDGIPDETRHLSLVRELDRGDLSLFFDFTQFNLGPTETLDPKFHRGFSRPVISKAFGGGNYMSVALNWQGPSAGRPDRIPYLAFNTKWNPNLPVQPGKHGVILTSGTTFLSKFEDGKHVPDKIALFVCQKPKEWVMTGLFNTKRSGIIPAHVFSKLPEWTRDEFVKAFLNKKWGQAKVAAANCRLAEDAEAKGTEPVVIGLTEASIRSALLNGHLSVLFTILEYRGYSKELFRKLMDAAGEPIKMDELVEAKLEDINPPNNQTGVKEEERPEEEVGAETEIHVEDREEQGIKEEKLTGVIQETVQEGPRGPVNDDILKREGTVIDRAEALLTEEVKQEDAGEGGTELNDSERGARGVKAEACVGER